MKNSNFLGFGNLFVGITQGGYPHTHEYVPFNLKNPRKDARLIGVNEGDRFAVAFRTHDPSCRYAFALYVDGINIAQKNGIKSLANIPEAMRADRSQHQCMVITFDKAEDPLYCDRYSQSSGANREFTFTLDDQKGVNYNTIQDPSQTSKIEVYMWKEVKQLIRSMGPTRSSGTTRGTTRSAVGAGSATNKAYGVNKEKFQNPEFLGKATFVHLPSSALAHLGKCLVPVKKDEQLGFSFDSSKDDPMDFVPRT